MGKTANAIGFIWYTTTMDFETLKLLQSQSIGGASGGSSGGLGESLGGFFTVVTALSIILMVVIVVFWLIGYINHRKTQKAILEIRDMLTEMNAREKVRREQPSLLYQPSRPQAIADVKGVSAAGEASTPVESGKPVDVL